MMQRENNLTYHAYVINLPYAKERRKHMQETLDRIGIDYTFIEGVIGKDLTLPHPHYHELKYRLAHGKRTTPGEIGCYLSHIKTLKTFLQSPYTHALILEDDIEITPDLPRIIRQALQHAHRFDLLKLNDFHRGVQVPIKKLDDTYTLSCSLTRQTGSGGYLVNKKAAEVLSTKLLPMWLPYDHAFDREWLWKLRALCIKPSPIIQSGAFETQICVTKDKKYPFLVRYATVFPFRAYNEISRLFFRSIEALRQKLFFR